MIRALKVLFERIKRLFKKKPSKPLLGSSEETHWVEPIYDATLPGHKSGAGGWVNVWGFREGCEGNWTYWVGYDYRWMGIRTQLSTRNVRQLMVNEYYSPGKAQSELGFVATPVRNAISEFFAWRESKKN